MLLTILVRASCLLVDTLKAAETTPQSFFFLFILLDEPSPVALFFETFLQSDSRLKWEVTKCKYVVDVLKSILQVSGLHLSIPFSGDLLVLLPTFVHTYLYFVLLRLEKRAHYFCV